jgi:Zn-dependent protease with chaperone function
MILAAVENFIFLNTLLTAVCFVFAWAARRAASRGLRRPTPDKLSQIYSLAIIFPPLTTAWVIAATLFPQWLLGEDRFEAAHTTPWHRVHLFGEMTGSFEPVLAYGVLAFAAGGAGFALWSSLRGYFRIGGVIARLETQAAPPPPGQLALVEHITALRGLDVGLVHSNYPFSFVWGFGRSKLVLSSGLLNMLTTEELAGVLEHEAAHHTRRDNLIRLALNFLGVSSLAFPLSRRLLRWRSEQVEMVCDEVAVARTLAPLEIAEALVKLRRQTLAMPTPAAASSFIPDDPSIFELRVRHIIALSDAPPTPARAESLTQPRKTWLWAGLTAFVFTLAAVYTFAPLSIHRAVESLIRFLE